MWIALIGSALLAQAEGWSQAAPGRRVEIRFLHGQALTGTVLSRARDDRSLVLDLSDSYAAVAGSLKVVRERVGSVRILEAQERRPVEQVQAAVERDEQERRARQAAEREAQDRRLALLAQAGREQQRLELELQRADLLRRSRARRIYERFPEYGGWGERAYQEIGERTAQGRYPPSVEELEFYENYALWEEGRDLYIREFNRAPPYPPVIHVGGPWDGVVFVRLVPWPLTLLTRCP
jgi:hypothetical protein